MSTDVPASSRRRPGRSEHLAREIAGHLEAVERLQAVRKTLQILRRQVSLDGGNATELDLNLKLNAVMLETAKIAVIRTREELKRTAKEAKDEHAPPFGHPSR